jgi:thiamine biosynthesis lipoprotein
MQRRRHRFAFKAMGSPCALELYDTPEGDVAAVADECVSEAGRLEFKYSRFRSDSLLSRINASAGDTDGFSVDPESASLLDYSDIAHQQSGGLFDVTSGVLRKAWNFASNRLPDPDLLAASLAQVGWHKLRWQSPRLFLAPGMELDLGGVVKEYAADRLAALCRQRGVRHGLVDLGGDLCAVGPHPDGAPWQVGVRDPRHPERAMATIPLAEGGIESSGDYERFMIVDDVRYGHILDPRTGWPVEGLRSVSVVASHCLIAGTASTVAMLEGVEEGMAFLDGLGLPNLRMDRGGRLSGTLATPDTPVPSSHFGSGKLPLSAGR